MTDGHSSYDGGIVLVSMGMAGSSDGFLPLLAIQAMEASAYGVASDLIAKASCIRVLYFNTTFKHQSVPDAGIMTVEARR